ncbi:MAG: DUF3467 domain-containing protein [Bacteroidaceae bacterium]|nr:DUF3467 domain-containing protein [Bacteroidaceae bacterium]
MAEEKQQQLQIELKPEQAGGTYSNLAVITHSNCEFVIDFVQMLPAMPKAQVASRIIMAPEHAKRLLFALQDNVQKYEQNFGQIQLQQPQQSKEGRTIAPFNIKKGEA